MDNSIAKLKIAHLTSVHPRYDVRIFLKECRSLAAAGYDVSLVVADGLPDEVKEGVKIFAVRKEKNRLNRILLSPGHVYRKALSLNCSVYHLHDPEMIRVGLRLKKKGKFVIFDSHEDIPLQLLNKPYLPKPVLRFISFFYALYEKYALKKFDYIIAATPFIKQKFLSWNVKSGDINNYPLQSEFNLDLFGKETRENFVCYTGGISSIRGIRQMIEAISHCRNGIRLKLAGDFSPPGLKDAITNLQGYDRTDILGLLGRKEMGIILGEASAGLIIFLPLPNHIDSQPNKMFEYMSAGLPVICSNFPLWKEIIEKNQCGICVDPLNPLEISGAIDFLALNKDEAKRMGQNGREAVTGKYNWKNEERKLLNLYNKWGEI